MRKLNNKGMTTVEILVCFVLTVVVLVSMYTSVSVYSTKRSIESVRQQVLTYKDTVTKDIMSDLTKYGVSAVNVTQTKIGGDPDNDDYDADQYQIDFTLAKSLDTKSLIIKRRLAYSAQSLGYNNTITHTYLFFNFDGSEGSDATDFVSEEECNFIADVANQGAMSAVKENYYNYCIGLPAFTIEAGDDATAQKTKNDNKLKYCGDPEKKIMPFLIADRDRNNVINDQDVNYCREVVAGTRQLEGFVQSTVVEGVTDNRYDDYFSLEYDNINYALPDLGSSVNDNGKKVYDLRIADVIVTAENDVVDIHIVLQHRDFGNRYAINIVVPYGL